MNHRSAQKIWEAALGELQVQVSKPNYRTWLEKTAGLDYQNNQFTVCVHNTFVAEYLDRNQRSLIEKTLINVTSSPDIKVIFQVDSKRKNSSGAQASDWQRTPATPCAGIFKPNYIFNSFVVGDCNHLAYSASQGVAQNIVFSLQVGPVL